MNVQVQERPVVAEQSVGGAVVTDEPAQEVHEGRTRTGTAAAETAGRWEREWLWVLLVVLFGAVVFGAMYVLTMLAGGPGYPY